jgi:hypothetical protein
MEPEINKDELIDSRSKKNGMASAMIKTMTVIVNIRPSHVAQPFGVVINRMIEFRNMRPWR